MASAQRPVSLAAIEEKVTEPAWKTLPSWYLIGRQDEVISPAAQRFMAKRAKAHTVEINSSHASYVSHPDEVTKLILRAARSVGGRSPPPRRGYVGPVLRFLSRLAVYFGLKADDEPGCAAPSAPRSTKSLVTGGVIVGAGFALITSAFGDFDDSAGGIILRAAIFGAGMVAFWYLIDRAPRDRSHDAKEPRRP